MEEVNISFLTIKVIVGFVALFFIIIITRRTSISQLTPFHLVFILVLGDFLGNTIYEDGLAPKKWKLKKPGSNYLLKVIAPFYIVCFASLLMLLDMEPLHA
ncbi:hypothetical protein ACFFHF_04765 [Robertmurraya beringensis]|uniref:YetF-like N-terminal transmembrane domain-containing protein n=1 Tax=Robertmurraya beringensis TaxID=641660 RepID=A0ABV6KMQ9_9BACI